MSAIRLRSISSGPAIKLRSVAPGIRLRSVASPAAIKLRVSGKLPGPANVLSIGTVTDGVTADATITGSSPSQVLNLVLPKGDKGDTGATGPQGPKGDDGDQGPTGATGPANSLSIGTVEDGPTADATITGTAPTQTLNLVLPKGDQGDPGDAATIAVGTVTTVDPTDPATVTNVGTSAAAVFNFEIPKGADGAGAVDSVFGRSGVVTAATSDYDASQIDNDSSVVGSTVKDALETLAASGGAVDSVNGQTGVVVLDPDDLDDTATTHKFTTASDISKLSGIEASADVTDAGNVGPAIHGATAKTSLVDNDEFALIDSAASNVLKRITWANVYASIWSVLGAVIAGGTGKTTPIDADTLALSDSAASNATKKLTWANLKATLKTYFDGIYQASGSYQPLDSDLTTIAGLTATTDNFLQAKSSTWASRTPAQVTADLPAVVGDSGSGGTKGLVPAPSAGDAAANKYLKANGTWATVTASGSKAADQQVFTSSGTWTKPSGFSAKAYAFIQCWGPGGGGGRQGLAVNSHGGGGGSYAELWIPLSSLGSTESVTIPSGGLGRTGSNGAGADGGTTTFGSKLSAYGGSGGNSSPDGVGGGPWGMGLGTANLYDGGNNGSDATFGGGGGASGGAGNQPGRSKSASPGASNSAGVPTKANFAGGGACSTTNNTNGGDGGNGKVVATVFDGA